jgi:Holliday junction resolvase RusA-like endonuclease
MHLESHEGVMDEFSGYDRSPVEDHQEESPLADELNVVEFFVGGEPVPQGSTKSFYIKKLNRVVTTHGNKNTNRWRERIAHEAQCTDEARICTFFSDDRRQGYDVQLSFVFTKPKSTPKKYKLNTKRPDLDKLIRAVLDGITDVLIPDDALVVSITASKCYGDCNQPPGLKIKVTRLP